MSLNSTPSSNRLHISFFGRRNAGKSSLVNAVTAQEISLVSDVKGTTTDPVSKAMELLPLGPVVITDTPGIDDEGGLGAMRVKRAIQALNKADAAVLVVDITEGLNTFDFDLIKSFKEKNVPYIIAYNKSDLMSQLPKIGENEIIVSAEKKEGVHKLKEMIASIIKLDGENRRLVGDLVNPMDFVILVTPIDASAPKGRLILPQQQTIRDLLEANAVSVVIKETELKDTLEAIGKQPALVITDSQAFERVSRETPPYIPLTSFSILMARYKGFLDTAVKGVCTISSLHDGDKILICEGCTHHRQCGDIGSVKLPYWLKKYTGAELEITNTSGNDFPEDLSPYKLIIHCGGCMITEREVKYRMKCAADQNIPFTNYGIAIAYMNEILERSIEIFPQLLTLIKRC